jgi:hypothetical protein
MKCCRYGCEADAFAVLFHKDGYELHLCESCGNEALNNGELELFDQADIFAKWKRDGKQLGIHGCVAG